MKLKVSWPPAFLWYMSQTRRDWNNSRRGRTQERNSEETVRRLGTIIQSIFCTQSGAGIRLNFWKYLGESRYPGALSPVLENFRRALSPDPTDCPWVSEDVLTAISKPCPTFTAVGEETSTVTPDFFSQVFAKNSLINNIFEEEKKFDSRTWFFGGK